MTKKLIISFFLIIFLFPFVYANNDFNYCYNYYLKNINGNNTIELLIFKKINNSELMNKKESKFILFGINPLIKNLLLNNKKIDLSDKIDYFGKDGYLLDKNIISEYNIFNNKYSDIENAGIAFCSTENIYSTNYIFSKKLLVIFYPFLFIFFIFYFIKKM